MVIHSLKKIKFSVERFNILCIDVVNCGFRGTSRNPIKIFYEIKSIWQDSFKSFMEEKIVGWKAAVKDTSEICGPITNTSDIPADKNPGDEIKLTIVSVKGNNTSFRYNK